MQTPRRGSIYRLKSDDVGKKRRVLIVSRTELNKGIYCIGIPFYGERVEERSRYPTCVRFDFDEAGVTKPCVAKADEITKFKINELRMSEGAVGEVPSDLMAQIESAIAYSLGLKLAPTSEA